MSDMSVAGSSSVAHQARQDAAELRNQEKTNRAAERSSGASSDDPAVNLSASSGAESVSDLNIKLDEMARAAETSAREDEMRDQDMAVRDAQARETALRDEEAARELAKEASAQIAREQLSMTTSADRNILQYLTG